MTALYVQEQGSVIRRAGRRLVVAKGERALHSVRLRELERVVVFGQVELSASALAMLLEAGVETVFLSSGGRFRGRLVPEEAKNVFLRQTQFRKYEEPEFRLRVARTLVDAKVRNARALVQQHHWNHPAEGLKTAVGLLADRRRTLKKAPSLPALLGCEGEAARVYFSALGSMVRAEFAFRTRSRRPPLDPVNALLSFGYTLLATELTGAVAAQGLDPHVGVLHDLNYGRPSLALDLLEEFRSTVIDRLALSLVNRGVLQAHHFEDRGAGGVLLNDTGRPRFLKYYHRVLETDFTEHASGERVSFRSLLARQARRMRGALLDEAEYVPFTDH